MAIDIEKIRDNELTEDEKMEIIADYLGGGGGGDNSVYISLPVDTSVADNPSDPLIVKTDGEPELGEILIQGATLSELYEMIDLSLGGRENIRPITVLVMDNDNPDLIGLQNGSLVVRYIDGEDPETGDPIIRTTIIGRLPVSESGSSTFEVDLTISPSGDGYIITYLVTR